jgi:hypothetical protein
MAPNAICGGDGDRGMLALRPRDVSVISEAFPERKSVAPRGRLSQAIQIAMEQRKEPFVMTRGICDFAVTDP